jgi:hypothetical protein
MHPSQTYSFLQKKHSQLKGLVRNFSIFFRKRRQLLPFAVSKITYQIEVSLLHTDYIQISYYDGENKKAVIKECFGKKNRIYFSYLNREEVPDYFKIFVNTKSSLEVCTVSILSSEYQHEMRFEISKNYPSGQWYFCYLRKSHYS